MQAADGRKTRWESARNRALRLVRRLGDGDRVTLIAAGARAEVLASAELNRAAVESALEGLSPADTPDNMAPALEMAFALLREGRGKQDAGAGGPPGRVRDEDVTVHIVTDRSGDALGIGDRGSGRKVHLERVGAPEGNTAITAIAVYGEPFTAGREVSIYVTAENFSEKTFSGSLRATADGKRIGARAVTLAPGEALTTKVGDRLPEGVLEVLLEPPDALPVDNKAYALPSGRRISRIVLFTRDEGCAVRFSELAAAIPNLTLDVRSPDAYASTDVESYQVAIFHRCEPEEEPGTDFLLICPPAKSRLVSVVREWVSGVSFLDWDERHPVGENLRGLQNVGVSGCRILEAPPWARPVVISATTSGDIPLVLCGEFRGRRAAVMSFDLCEIQLRKSGSLPALILLLNTLAWLATDEANQVKTGEPFRALVPVPDQPRGGVGKEGVARYTVINPAGKEEAVGGRAGEPLVYSNTEYVGRYLISGEVAEREFVANLCDREESDLRGGGAAEDKPAVEHVISISPVPEAPPERSGLFLLLAVALMLVEWLLWTARGAPAEMEEGRSEGI
jgi:hypothetical protein